MQEKIVYPPMSYHPKRQLARQTESHLYIGNWLWISV